MTTAIKILEQHDIPKILDAIMDLPWSRDESVYQRYLLSQNNNENIVFLAFYNRKFAGHVNLKWHSEYPYFANNNIPEISDLLVINNYRRIGIATKLLKKCEETARKSVKTIGLGVGLYEDYRPAQCLYVKQGYTLDCNGATSYNTPIKAGKNVFVDDDLLIWMTKKLDKRE